MSVKQRKKLETKEAERLVLTSEAQKTVIPSSKTARLRPYLRHNKETNFKHAKEVKANPEATAVHRAICMQQNVNSDIHFFEPFHNQSHSLQRSGRSRKASRKTKNAVGRHRKRPTNLVVRRRKNGRENVVPVQKLNTRNGYGPLNETETETKNEEHKQTFSTSKPNSKQTLEKQYWRF
ncbi:hypothetical protein K469DRAFT_684146 [Zopfia rhizophila CBS 207.26]|uniref:Uncharacterized protein n=1 Tax=Zopfia rhizophila CBS 207.26 TaxID=1314779 RepID=A0A6A6EAG1_9PEZI|nr:hypothetical protein K469DRAFT_684146 [Zopfia rhizophila CBS 207.26]